MMFETTAYQTIENRGDIKYILENAPFKCSNKYAWLTEGYYFWDYNIDDAKRWGSKYQKNGYVVVECELFIENMFDLVGNAKHIAELRNLFQLYISDNAHVKKESAKLCVLLQLLRNLNETPEYNGIFDYEAIRAQDFPRKDKFLYGGSKGEFMFSNPRIQICLFEKKQSNFPKGFCIKCVSL